MSNSGIPNLHNTWRGQSIRQRNWSTADFQGSVVHGDVVRWDNTYKKWIKALANSVDKDYLNLEMGQLASQVEAISINTKFNNKPLLDGSTFTFYTDIDVAGSAITTPATDMAVTALGVASGVASIGGGVIQGALSSVVSAIDGALAIVDNRRAALGAVSNRFDHIIDNLQNVIMNTVSSKSRIVDADFSIETTNLTRNTVLRHQMSFTFDVSISIFQYKAGL